MRKELFETLQNMMKMKPACRAEVRGSQEYPDLEGNVWFYPFWDGAFVIEGASCTGNATDPFADTGSHYNPGGCEHPQHAGDFPPLFENDGYALTMFYTNRFVPEEVEGRCVVIHAMPDDFRTQPSGDSGMKIACGVIVAE